MKKNLAALIGLTVAATGASCGINKTLNFPKSNEQILNNVKEGDTEVFEPYKHVFYIRCLDNCNIEENMTKRIEVPEGYEILSLIPVIDGNSCNHISITRGYDIWYVNTERVEVTATYDEVSKKYDYITFGKSISDEKETEKKLIKNKNIDSNTTKK